MELIFIQKLSSVQEHIRRTRDLHFHIICRTNGSSIKRTVLGLTYYMCDFNKVPVKKNDKHFTKKTLTSPKSFSILKVTCF